MDVARLAEAELVSVGLSGDLSDFGIADVFQLIGQQRKTGVLELKNASARAQLGFDRGLVVTAGTALGRSSDLDPLADRLIRCGQLTRERADEAIAVCRASAQTLARTLVERGWLDEPTVRDAQELVTRDTIFDVLRWQSGTFDFRAQPIYHDRDPAELLGAEQILMDGLRMVDEWQSFAALVPSEETVFARVPGFEPPAAARARPGAADPAHTARVLSLIDGRLSARRVIDLARLGTFDGMRCLSELCQAGAVQPMTPGGVRQVRRHTWSGRGALTRQRTASALVPLVALAGVAWWTATSSAAPVPASDHRIERSTLASLRDDYAARAVRHALEAYRLGRGRWPERLEELESARLLPAGALATLSGRPYYSAHREPGPIFLAPER
jgi:hypothetical protein